MVDAGEKVPDICLQHPAFRGFVLPPVVAHIPLQAVEAEQDSLPDLRSAVGRDEAPSDDLIQVIIYQPMLHHFVNKSWCLNEPFLRFVNKKGLELAGDIGFCSEDVGQPLSQQQGICLILCCTQLFPLSPPRRQVCPVKHLEGANLIKCTCHCKSEGGPHL